jgi:drug/metabolite transporter (DMT)-like permease
MQTLGYVYAISAAVTWGLVYTLDQKILSKTSPLGLLFIDAVITLLLSAPFFLYRRGEVINIFSNKVNLAIILSSAILAIVANFFIYSAIQRLGASLASTFEISYPFFVTLFTLIAFGGETNLAFWSGAGLIFLGSLIIIRFT